MGVAPKKACNPSSILEDLFVLFRELKPIIIHVDANARF